MIHHAWTVLAQNVFLDGDTNRAAIVVAEQVGLQGSVPEITEGLLALGVRIELLSLWWREGGPSNETFQTKLKIMFGDRTVDEHDVEVSFENSSRARSRINLATIPYVGMGTYVYAVERLKDGAWQTEARVPLVVQSFAPPVPSRSD